MPDYKEYRRGLVKSGATTKPMGRNEWESQQTPATPEPVLPTSTTPPPTAFPGGPTTTPSAPAQTPRQRYEAINGPGSFDVAQAAASAAVSAPAQPPPPAQVAPHHGAYEEYRQTIKEGQQAMGRTEWEAAGSPTGLPVTPVTPESVLPPPGEPSVPTPELGPLFGDTPPQEELGETFDREYFDPLALYTERETNKQLEEIEKYKAEQEALTAEQAASRDAALEQRRISAEGKRAAQRNVSGLEQQALLSQIERSKRASFNQLRGQLAKMGAYGTTGSGELDFAVLGEIYEGKSIDVRVAANKGLRDIEIAYFQIRDSIESDQSKSDIEKAQSLQQLNERTFTEWQSIQQNKQETITQLAKEAFSIGAEEEKRIRDQALDLVMKTLATGQPVSDALLEEAGYKGTQLTVAKEIMGKASDAQSAAQRLDWINSSIMDDFNIDETVIKQAANLLGIPYEELLADAQKWASAARYEFQSKQSVAGGGETAATEFLKGEMYIDPKSGRKFIIRQEKGGTATSVTDEFGNPVPEIKAAEIISHLQATPSVPGGMFSGLTELVSGAGQLPQLEKVTTASKVDITADTSGKSATQLYLESQEAE